VSTTIYYRERRDPRKGRKKSMGKSGRREGRSLRSRRRTDNKNLITYLEQKKNIKIIYFRVALLLGRGFTLTRESRKKEGKQDLSRLYPDTPGGMSLLLFIMRAWEGERPRKSLWGGRT